MEILKDISILWSMIHTLVLFLFLFEARYPKKKTLRITLITMVPLVLLNLVLFVVLGAEKYGTLMLLSLSLPSCIVFWLIAKYRGGRFFFTFCMVDTTVLEIVYITSILNHYLTPDTYLVMFFIRLVSYPLIELWVYRKLRPIYLDVQKTMKRGWNLFAIIGLLFYVVITLIMTFPDNIVNRPEQIPALILMFILMPVIYIHIILTLRRQQKAHEQSKRDSVARLQVESVMARMNELNAANEAFRQERHDFRHKLNLIGDLVEKGQFDAVAAVIGEYEEALDKTQVVRYCAHSAIVDAALSAYIRKAESLGIPLKLGFAFPETFKVDEYELATALANAIENAIQATMKLPEEERSIEIKTLCKPQFIIMVRNSFDGIVAFDKDELPLAQKEGHGYGTRTICAVCHKVGGVADFTANGRVFTLFMHLK